MPVFNNALAGAAGSGGAAEFKIERSLRFNSVDSANLSKTFSSAGNRRTFTFSCWIKRTKLAREAIFSAGSAVGSSFGLEFNGNNTLDIYDYNGSFTWRLETTPVFRDPASFFHLILSVDTTQATASNRVKVYINGSQVTNFDISNYPSQNHESFVNNNILHTIGSYQNNTFYSNALLSDIHFIDGQALAPTDFGEVNADTGVWDPKAYSGTYGTNGFRLNFSDNSSNAALGTDSSGNNNTWTVNNLQAANSGNGNYIANLSSNGSNTYTQDVPNFLKSFDGNLNTQWSIARSATVVDGTLTFPGGYTMQDANNGLRIYTGASWYLSSFLYRVYYQVNGSGYTMIGSTSDTNAVGAPKRWVTIPVPGGTLNSLSVRTHSDNSSWGSSWASAVELDGVILTDNLIGIECDSLIDSPTNYEADSGNNGGNYCVLNPLDQNTATLTNGNLQADVATDGARFVRGSIAVSSGKWYWECTTLSGTAMALGVAETTGTGNLTHSQSYYYYANNGTLYGNQSGLNGSFSGSQLANGDVLGVALDMDAGTLKFYKNGSLIGTAWTGLTGKLVAPIVGNGGGASNITALNFGQRPFSISSVPTGYKSLCTQNLDAPPFDNPKTAFEVKTYEGNSGTQTISLDNSPDLVWVKSYSAAWDHEITATVLDANKAVASNLDAQEFNTVIEPGTNGFYLDGQSGYANTGGTYYVSWNWDAGTTTVTNQSGGTITPSGLRANPSTGCSVIKYSGVGDGSTETIPHGLNAAPEFVAIKNLTSNSTAWAVYHKGAGAGGTFRFDTTVSTESTSMFDGQHPSSSIITLKENSNRVNNSGQQYLAMCWTPIPGFSAMGTYEGGDSPFVYCGFRPALVMIKNVDLSGEEMVMYDVERNKFNYAYNTLYTNSASGNYDGSDGVPYPRNIDILSNGFRANNGNPINQNGTHVWAAWAEHPLKYARAR